MSKRLKGKFNIVFDPNGNRDDNASYWCISSDDIELFKITVEEICKQYSSMSYDKIATKEYGNHLLKWWRERTQGLTAFW